jgi:TetR/AcrR family fatty acid metabolism transcriptional regulator
MNRSEAAIERKSQIVKATVECISRHGYNNFSMQDVAHTAGVSKGIIHYYFLNKDDLMMSVLETVATDLADVLIADLQVQGSPKEKLVFFVKTCLNVVRTTKEFYQVNMDFWTQINQKEEVRHIIARHYRKLRETGAQVVAEGIQAGVFRAVEPHEYASIVIALVDGLSLQWLFDEASFDFDQLQAKVLDLVLGGLKIER